MYKCHLCELETAQLNGLMSKHYQKHCLSVLSKEQYKRDLLIFNGRSPNNCKICNKETIIPKGESEYPQYCRPCFVEKLKNSNGELNTNWRGGERVVNCAFCNSKIEKHSSHLKRLKKFCSISCCQSFYGLPENRTDAQMEHGMRSTTGFWQINMKKRQNDKRTTEERRAYYKIYHIRTRELNKERKRTYERLRRKVDINFRLITVLRSRLNKVIKSNDKNGSTTDNLGCSISFLKLYMESKFVEGMTWENYGRYGWHIDHIIPLSRFDLKDEAQLKKACHYTNLQPLWAADNLSKSNKLLV